MNSGGAGNRSGTRGATETGRDGAGGANTDGEVTTWKSTDTAGASAVTGGAQHTWGQWWGPTGHRGEP